MKPGHSMPVVFAIVALAGLVSPAVAQGEYPTKPLRLVVPYPPGGTTDILARALGAALGAPLRQNVIIDNRPGANGNIGLELVAKAPADGYTLVMGSVGPLTINPSIYSRMPVDVIKDFAPVSQIAEVPLVLVVHPSLPVSSVRRLISLAKARPGDLTFGSSGNGSSQHLAGELFKLLAGVKMRHVPYRGAAQAVTDLLAGRIDLMIDLIPTALPHITAGKLRALAVTTLKRVPALPDLPTLDESGLRGFDVTSWFGVLVPAATPSAIVVKLNREIGRALETANIKERFASQGAEPAPTTPQGFATKIKSELAKWAKVVREAHVHID